MFTSEVVLQWRLKVGREALEMIMCFAFFSLKEFCEMRVETQKTCWKN